MNQPKFETADVGDRDQEFVISRTFDAPRELVWKAWTEPERMREWFGPTGFTMPVCTQDLRPGGAYHYCLRGAEGQEMWGKFVFREIHAPERLVFINTFSDAQGGITRHPMSETWPLEMLSTITFAEEKNRTTVTIRWSPHNATEAERRTFAESHAGMKQGWSGTFEQLADYLAKAMRSDQ